MSNMGACVVGGPFLRSVTLTPEETFNPLTSLAAVGAELLPLEPPVKQVASLLLGGIVPPCFFCGDETPLFLRFLVVVDVVVNVE